MCNTNVMERWMFFANALACFGVLLCVPLLVVAAEIDESNNSDKRVKSKDAAENTVPMWKSPVVPLNKNWDFELPFSLELGSGFQHGDGVLQDAGAVVQMDSEFSPAFRFKKRIVRLGVDLAFFQQYTFGFSMVERHRSGGPNIRIRPNSKLDFGAKWDIGYIDKPNWPDPYQPELDDLNNRTGRLLRTDRNSYFFSEVDGYLKVKFHRRFSSELYGAYGLWDYEDDPHYNAVDSPTHLVPGDRTRVRGGLDMTGTTSQRFWRFSLDTRLDLIQYTKTYSRDAQTGFTHAGGVDTVDTVDTPSNPLQRFVVFQVRQRNSVRLVKDVLKLILIAEYTHHGDTFDNYYTWNGVAGGGGLIFTPSNRWRIDVGYNVDYHRYTKDGYAASDTGTRHPALDNGDTVRMERLHRVDARVEMALGKTNLALFVEGKWKQNRTNFPDYAPHIFPTTAEYQIDWDYTNWRCLGGIAFEL